MPRNRVIYNSEAAFVGPAPSSGFHFIDGNGVLNNTGNSNLIKSLPRLQAASYSISVNYIDIAALGKKGNIQNVQTVPPSVGLNLDFIQNSVLPELRVGLLCNTFNPIGSVQRYSNNFSVSLISGLYTRLNSQPALAPFWPSTYRDKRNIFIPISPEGQDLNKTTYYSNDPTNNVNSVYAFGDCYLTSYNARGAVGNLPTCSLSYVCENFEVWASGSGISIPAINAQTYSGYSSIKVNLPSNYDSTGDNVSTLLPGDITLAFTSYPQSTGVLAVQGTGYIMSANSSITNLAVNFSDIKIQDYEISMALPREPLYSIGYKAPVDRPIVFPIFANLSVSAIVGDSQTGNMVQLFNQNSDYDVSVRMRNPSNALAQGVGKQFDFKKAKLLSYSLSSSIGSNNLAAINWIAELDPDDLSKGLFISGILRLTDREIFA